MRQLQRELLSLTARQLGKAFAIVLAIVAIAFSVLLAVGVLERPW